MRIFHIGDLHLGKIVNGFLLLEDQKYILNEIIKMIKENNVETLIIAGDIYDKRNPSDNAVVIFNDFLFKLSKLSINVLIISGNHDSGTKLEFGNFLFETSNIYIVGNYLGSINKVVLNDEYGPINFYFMPFIRPALLKEFDEEVDTYHSAILSALNNTSIDYNQRNIFIGHQFFMSGSEERSDSEVISIGGIDNVGHYLLKDFDYAALGHLHKPQKLEYDYIRYSGSPLVFSKSEVEHNKSLVMLDIFEKSNINIKLLPLIPKRDFIHIKGFINEILDNDTYDSEAYTFITLYDEDEIINAIGKLRNKFPYLMNLTFENEKTKSVFYLGNISVIEDDNPIDLFKRFFKEINNKEVNDNQSKIIETIMEGINKDATN